MRVDLIIYCLKSFYRGSNGHTTSRVSGFNIVYIIRDLILGILPEIYDLDS